MTYKRMTKTERILIYKWRQEGLIKAEIASRLGRSRSAITRELDRNSGGKGYRPQQAHKMSVERAKRPGLRVLTERQITAIKKGISNGLTPAIISGRARFEGQAFVCPETIYKYIYAEAKTGGELWKNLPRAHRRRRRRCPRIEGQGRGKLKNQVSIDQRPSEVDTRETFGHWEGDLINGANGTGNLVTLVERKSRFTLVARTDTKCAEEVTKAICKLFKRIPQKLRISLTLDNGKEFAGHEVVASKTGAKVYFAHPYHSWERGTNENTNGLIRRLHPKKSSFIDIDCKELKRIESFVNDRPRKILGWMTPTELFSKQVDVLKKSKRCVA